MSPLERLSSRVLAENASAINPCNADLVSAIQAERNKLKERLNRITALFKTRDEKLMVLIQNENAKCTHVFPDGKSAWRGGFMFSSCSICGADDL